MPPLSTLMREAASPKFNPASVSGLMFDLDANRLSGADGTAISSFTDQSGNGRHAVQATGSKQGTLQTVSAKRMLRLDGTDDNYELPPIDLTGTSAVTGFMVFSNPTPLTRMVFEVSPNQGAVDDAFYLVAINDGTSVWELTGNVGTSHFQTSTTITTLARIASGVLDKSLTTGEVRGWVDGNPAAASSGNNNNTNAFGNRVSYIGARAGTSLFLAGDIGRILLYNKALSAAEHNYVGAGLASIYGRTWTTVS